MDIGGEVSDSEHNFDFNHLIFVLRQIMLSEVKCLTFDVSDLDSCIQFSHFCVRSGFWLSTGM